MTGTLSQSSPSAWHYGSRSSHDAPIANLPMIRSCDDDISAPQHLFSARSARTGSADIPKKTHFPVFYFISTCGYTPFLTTLPDHGEVMPAGTMFSDLHDRVVRDHFQHQRKAVDSAVGTRACPGVSIWAARKARDSSSSWRHKLESPTLCVLTVAPPHPRHGSQFSALRPSAARSNRHHRQCFRDCP
jgi:hypothetical protein